MGIGEQFEFEKTGRIEHVFPLKAPPYLFKTVVKKYRLYNPLYGDDRVCKCGHTYYRHFDWMEELVRQDVGCKYCDCVDFVEASDGNLPEEKQ